MSTSTTHPHPGTVELAELLAAWNHHQQLRSQGAAIPVLFASRVRLDDARDSIRAGLAA